LQHVAKSRTNQINRQTSRKLNLNQPKKKKYHKQLADKEERPATERERERPGGGWGVTACVNGDGKMT